LIAVIEHHAFPIDHIHSHGIAQSNGTRAIDVKARASKTEIPDQHPRMLQSNNVD
jgi:hypothetical protein